MKSYSDFSVNDFAADDFFCGWVINPTEESDAFWKAWMKENPEAAKVALKARKIVLSLNNLEKQKISDALVQETWKKIESQTRSSSKIIAFPWSRLAAAASVVLLMVTGLWLWLKNDDIQSDPIARFGWTEVINQSNETKKIKLEDGTWVTLKPGSYVSYPASFEKDKRIIALKGEAFFEVTKDASRPFLVYAQETVTKVLGTSFNIKAFEKDELVEVIVRTGKVAVYAQRPADSGQLPADSEKHIVVTPNQKVIFNRKDLDLQKSLDKNPEPVIPIKELPKQKFEEAPLSEVFESLQTAYQVEIIFDKEALEKCRLTTTLNDQPLFEKLSIICDALGLEYREEDARIIITGSGCSE